MKNVTLKAGNEQDFFRRGKLLARWADAGQPMPEERTVSFEDPADLLRLLTASRLDVFRSVKGEPGSITVIAARLQRDRSAVKRDVDQLARVGLVTIEAKTLPGHGQMKEIRASAGVFRLEATVE
ncbi:MAG: MarR family transcriptional regulator [Betaproteobacteria bacterium]|nr:MarR family transcriptional regulator [Betaproteobacteria bacterium]NCS61533.1 MarR family transcriptional regulator [Rhodoferax sp.]PIZ22853.1 MAG: MarR family transcriptional regulator [Comamonadaceae bacterium CG_4_10_14_0_8_um_filter_57_29]PJC12628.1 MAG: MarR family transcriptional regulator [Comamonadaceae bacterium CG_4_9_14_0_8_um_filter_57_21]